MSADTHILVIGAGSVGKRHAENLAAQGVSISFVDPREDRRDELLSKLDLIGRYSTVEDALAECTYNGAVIASPPFVHVEQALKCVERKIPVLLEKPVSPSLKEARLLEAAAASTNVPVLLGYTWRWWPALKRVKAHLKNKTIGDVRHVRFVMSAHLADWHPWERYQDFFMASKAHGGGALLDESHWVDQMIWMFGMPKSVYGHVENISDLEIDSDDNVDIIAVYENGLRVTLHLDLYGRPHEKSIRFIGSKGSLLWTDSPNQVAIATTAEAIWKTEQFTTERNEMFQAVASEFLDIINGKGEPSCTLSDGTAVLRLIESVRTSSTKRKAVLL